MSVSKLDCYAEIFNFDTNIVYSKSVSSFTAIQNVKSLRNGFIPLKSSNYYLFGFIGCASNSNDDKIYFQKHKFPLILTTFPSIITYETNSYIPRPNGYYNYNFINIENAYGYEVSCFQTDDELIICFSLTKVDSNYYFNFIKYEKDLSDPKVKTIESIITDENLFNKCIHLKGEVGIFASYTKNNNINYPYFFLFEYDNENVKDFKNYLTTSSSTILLEKPNFNIYLLLNDIVKIN